MKLLFATMMLWALAARAEDTAKPVRVGASHRVDVITPGERVETAIDRWRRSGGPARDALPRPADRFAPRAPTERADRVVPDRADRAAPPQPQGNQPQQTPAGTGNPSTPRR
jgi:hypothetical protein